MNLLDNQQNERSSIAESNDKIQNFVKLDENISEIDSKLKKKLDKIAESILKKTPDQKFSTFEEKYYGVIQILLKEQESNKKLQLVIKENEKTLLSLTKQKELAMNDYTKSLIVKDKLEALCRELQKHNKSIKEENLQRIKEEEEKRKEISSKFQHAIDEINKQVSDNTEKNKLLIEENSQLANKLKNLLEQYDLREEHIEKVLKHKDLEIQLADAKYQQSELKFQELSEKSKNERETLENHSNELIKKCDFHIQSENQLKTQLSMYTEKYEEFQNTLKKSNQMFETFKAEMEKMTKKIKKLEQETISWKNKWENTDKSLQKILKEKSESDNSLKVMQTKYDTMEKISRALQEERNQLKEKLKQGNENSITQN